MTKKPKAILFDWDNTLVDTKPAIDIAIEIMFKEMGVDLNTIDRSDPSNYLSARDSLPQIFGDKWQEANIIYQKSYLKHQFDNIGLLKDAKEVLDYLRNIDTYISVVSNKLGSTLREEIKYLNLESYFVKAIGSLDAKKDKPSKEPVLMALQNSNIEPGMDVWFVGDSEVDMLCAVNSGCKPIFIGNEQNIKISNFENAHSVTDYNEFLNFIKKFI